MPSFLSCSEELRPIGTMKKNLPDAARLISRRELSERWDCSVENLKRYEKRGRLKPIKLSKRFLRYRLSDIEQLENESQVS